MPSCAELDQPFPRQMHRRIRYAACPKARAVMLYITGCTHLCATGNACLSTDIVKWGLMRDVKTGPGRARLVKIELDPLGYSQLDRFASDLVTYIQTVCRHPYSFPMLYVAYRGVITPLSVIGLDCSVASSYLSQKYDQNCTT